MSIERENAMSIENVREYLKQFSKDTDVLEFDSSSATVSLAAAVLGVGEGNIAKSLSLDLKGDTVLVICAGDRKIDNHKFKECFGTKAKMLPFDETLERTGHMAGGVCPFALKEGVRSYLDVSLKDFENVYPACGSPNSAIKLTPDELEKICENFSGWVDVTVRKARD